MSRRAFVLGGALPLATLCTPIRAQDPTRPGLLVFAAASLSNVLGALAQRYERQSGVRVKSSFAASSALARQIEAGSRADVFVSADEEWMDYLQRRQLIEPTSRRDLVGNRLVLIAPADSPISLRIAPAFPLRAALGDARLSTADPDTVPVGRYARAALTSLGVWHDVEDRLVRADNVRSALMFVARGEAPLGIVYRTDARAEPKVRIVDTFPASTHAPITYPAAMTIRASHYASSFLEFLSKPESLDTWRQFGFLELEK